MRKNNLFYIILLLFISFLVPIFFNLSPVSLISLIIFGILFVFFNLIEKIKEKDKKRIIKNSALLAILLFLIFLIFIFSYYFFNVNNIKKGVYERSVTSSAFFAKTASLNIVLPVVEENYFRANILTGECIYGTRPFHSFLFNFPYNSACFLSTSKLIKILKESPHNVYEFEQNQCLSLCSWNNKEEFCRTMFFSGGANKIRCDYLVGCEHISCGWFNLF